MSHYREHEHPRSAGLITASVEPHRGRTSVRFQDTAGHGYVASSFDLDADGQIMGARVHTGFGVLEVDGAALDAAARQVHERLLEYTHERSDRPEASRQWLQDIIDSAGRRARGYEGESR